MKLPMHAVKHIPIWHLLALALAVTSKYCHQRVCVSVYPRDISSISFTIAEVPRDVLSVKISSTGHNYMKNHNYRYLLCLVIGLSLSISGL